MAVWPAQISYTKAPAFSFLSLLDQSESGFERTAFVSQIALMPPSRCS
jgi:hypothetical protein